MPRQTGKPGLASNFARQTIRFEKLHPIEESIYIFEDKFNAKHCERLSQVLVQGGLVSTSFNISSIKTSLFERKYTFMRVTNAVSVIQKNRKPTQAIP